MTKKQRHEVYKKALVDLTNTGLNNYSICFSILFSSEIESIVDVPYFMEEFALFKPYESIMPFAMWLPSDDLQTRQIILDFCILMTKTK